MTNLRLLLFFNFPIDTSGEYIFVNKEESRFWLSLFLKNFLSISATKKDEDDLLFFVRKKPTKFFQQFEVCNHKHLTSRTN